MKKDLRDLISSDNLKSDPMKRSKQLLDVGKIPSYQRLQINGEDVSGVSSVFDLNCNYFAFV